MNKHSFSNKTIRLASIDSTNNYALKLIQKEHIDNGTVIISDYQTEGRGQRLNKWMSEGGLNLTFSIVLFPHWLRPDLQFLLSQLVCLGLADYLSMHIPDVKVKWPNDIYIKDKKVCGILIESAIRGMRLENSIVGIGLNVNQMEFDENAGRGTSMALMTGHRYVLEEVLSAIVKNIEKYYVLASQGNGDKIQKKYFDQLLFAGEMRGYKDENGFFNGKIEKVLPDGRLLIVKEDGTEYLYVFKEIEFIF